MMGWDLVLGHNSAFPPKKNMYAIYYKLVARYSDIQQLQKQGKISKGAGWRWRYARMDFADAFTEEGVGGGGDVLFLLSVYSCCRRPSRCQ
jgi:hypothetical protein